MTAIEQLKLKLDINDMGQDGLLSLLLDDAEDSILDYIGRDTLPDRLVSVQVELTVIAYNRLGAEGNISRSEGGISQSFVDGLSADMLQRLKNYPRKAGVMRNEVNEEIS